MKINRLFLISLFIIVLNITSCSKFSLFSETETKYHYEILKEINDTMTNNPEAAMELLNTIDSSTIHNRFSKQEYHEYQILLSEASYKNYYNQPNINEIIDACDYFDSLTALHPNNFEVLFLNSRAHYYRAVGLEELGETEKAFKSYLQSLELNENINYKSFRISDKFYKELLHFKALTYTRLGDILYWHDVSNAAIECISNANNLFEIENNQSVLSRNNIIMAVIYGLNNNHDKALYHLSIADSILKINNINVSLKNDIERIKASVMYNIGYKEEAFNSVIKQYKTLDDPKQKMEAAGVLGDMYYNRKDYDSAIYYYEKYFPDNKYSKINAANNIIEIAIITGNNELITKYAPSLAEETNKEIMLSSIKTGLSSLYHQHCIQKNNNDFYIVFFKHLILISILFLLALFFGLNMIKMKKQKYHNKIMEKSNYINLLQKTIEKTSSENKHIKLQIKTLENEIEDIKLKNKSDYISFDKKIDSMRNNHIFKKMYEISSNNNIKTNVKYPHLELDSYEQYELIELFNTTFDNRFNAIISEHKGLKHYDLLYFCLYIIGLDEKHISAVTGKTYNAVWNRTKKIQEIFGSDKKIKDIIKKELNY